jgi:hypothetical protein
MLQTLGTKMHPVVALGLHASWCMSPVMCVDTSNVTFRFAADVLATGSCLPTSALSTLEQQPNQAAAAAAPGSGKKQGNRQSSGTPQQQQQQQQEGAASGASTSNSSNVLVVLQCLQQLLPSMATEPCQQLLAAVDQLLAAPHLTAAAHKQQQQAGQATAAAGGIVTGAVRTACQQLQLQLMLRYLFDAVPDPTQDAAVSGWLAAAPKLLWEQGTARPHVSRLLLLMVYQAGRLAQPGSAVQQQLLQVQPQLAALLATSLPGSSSSSSKQSKKRKQQDGDQQQQQGGSLQEAAVAVLVGPLAGLPASVQSLAFDALCFQPQLQPQLLKAVALSCRLTSYSNAAVARLLDSVLAAAGSSMPPDQFLSFVATLLSGPPAGGYVDCSSGKNIGGKFDRHQQLVNAVCRWLHTYGPLDELLQLLAPVAVQQWQQQQQHGVVAGSSDSLRCSSYSCASLAALAAGCWCPAGSTSSSSKTLDKSSAAAAAVMPRVLLDQLSAVLAAYCTSSMTAAEGSSSSSDKVAAAGPSNQPQAMALAAVATAAAAAVGAEGTSAESAAVDACMPVLLPLLAAVPDCVLPFLEQLAPAHMSTGAAAAAVSSMRLAVAVHALRVVLAQQSLSGHLVQQEQQLQQLVGKLATAAQQLQQEGGVGAAGVVGEVQQLQAAVALLCGC